MFPFSVGDSASKEHTITESTVIAYGNVSEDHNPLHFDEKFASSTRFGRRIAHGGILFGYLSAIMASTLPGPGTIYVSQFIEFKSPVYIGNTVLVEVKVAEIKSNGIVRLINKISVENVLVARGESVVLFEQN